MRERVCVCEWMIGWIWMWKKAERNLLSLLIYGLGQMYEAL